MKDIYFTKIEFDYHFFGGRPISTILLNFPERELSYQVYENQRTMCNTQILHKENGKVTDKIIPARLIKTAKNNFTGEIISEEAMKTEVVFSYGIKLSESEIEKLLPYCNVADFEPYRDRPEDMSDPDVIGYRDEVELSFRGVSDSYLPLLKIPMNLYYRREWPTEKLYKYLLFEHLKKNKYTRRRTPDYFELSLGF